MIQRKDYIDTFIFIFVSTYINIVTQNIRIYYKF